MKRVGASVLSTRLVELEEGGNEAAYLSERRVLFGLPAVSCLHIAPNGALCSVGAWWSGGVVEGASTPQSLPLDSPLAGPTTAP